MVFILNNGFQLAGKYKVEAKASASCKKNIESQLEVYGSCVRGLCIAIPWLNTAQKKLLETVKWSNISSEYMKVQSQRKTTLLKALKETSYF